MESSESLCEGCTSELSTTESAWDVEFPRSLLTRCSYPFQSDTDCQTPRFVIRYHDQVLFRVTENDFPDESDRKSVKLTGGERCAESRVKLILLRTDRLISWLGRGIAWPYMKSAEGKARQDEESLKQLHVRFSGSSISATAAAYRFRHTRLLRDEINFML